MKTTIIILGLLLVAVFIGFITNWIKKIRIVLALEEIDKRLEITPKKQSWQEFLKKISSFLGDLSLSRSPETVTLDQARIRPETSVDRLLSLDTEINLNLNCLLGWSAWSSPKKLEIIKKELFEKIKTLFSLKDLVVLYGYYENCELLDGRLNYNNEKLFIEKLVISNDSLKKSERQQFAHDLRVLLETENKRVSARKRAIQAKRINQVIRNLEVKL